MTLLYLISSFSSSYAHPNRNPPVSGVALGVTTGPMFNSSTRGTVFSFTGGFYTDIPLLDTFYFTPSTTIYRYRSWLDLDLSLSFKFVVPVEKIRFMGGISAGLTSSETLLPHVGVFGGASFHFMNNLDWFINTNYLHQFDQPTTHSIAITTGPLFIFNN